MGEGDGASKYDAVRAACCEHKVFPIICTDSRERITHIDVRTDSLAMSKAVAGLMERVHFTAWTLYDLEEIAGDDGGGDLFNAMCDAISAALGAMLAGNEATDTVTELRFWVEDQRKRRRRY